MKKEIISKLYFPFRKRESWYALIVHERIAHAGIVPFEIFDIHLYSKTLHAVLALPILLDDSGKVKYKASQSS